MAVAGTLSVKLTADQAQFVANMKAAASEVVTFKGLMEKAAASAALFSAQLAQKAVSAMVQYVKEADVVIDRAAKMSDRLNINIQSLRELEGAADLAGVSAEELSSGMQKMITTLGQGKANDVIQKLGLNLSLLRRQDAGQTFQDIARKIAEIKSPSEQAAATVAIFGKMGTSLLPLLNSNLAETAVRFDTLHGTITREDAAKVEDFNDTITELESVASGLAETFLTAVVPSLAAVGQMILGNGQDWTSLRNTVAEFSSLFTYVMEAAVWSMRPLLTAWDVLKGVVYKSIQVILDSVRLLFGAINTGSRALGLGNVLPDLTAYSDEFAKSSKESFDAASSNFKKFVSFSDFRSGGGGVADAIEGVNKRAKDVGDKHEERAKAAREATTNRFDKESSKTGQTAHLSSASSFSAAVIQQLQHGGSNAQQQHLSIAQKQLTALTQLVKQGNQQKVAIAGS